MDSEKLESIPKENNTLYSHKTDKKKKETNELKSPLFVNIKSENFKDIYF